MTDICAHESLPFDNVTDDRLHKSPEDSYKYLENTCIQKRSSNMKRMIKSGKCMTLPRSNIIRHFLLETKLVFSADNIGYRERETDSPHYQRPPLKIKNKNPKHTLLSIIVKINKWEVLEIQETFQKPCLVTFTSNASLFQNFVLLPLQCLYIGLPLQAFPFNKPYCFLI